MNRGQKIVVVCGAALLLATWLWPAWYEYDAVSEGKWYWEGHHFALTYRSAQSYPVKIDWGRLIVFDLAILGPSAAALTLLARKRSGTRGAISGLN